MLHFVIKGVGTGHVPRSEQAHRRVSREADDGGGKAEHEFSNGAVGGMDSRWV